MRAELQRVCGLLLDLIFPPRCAACERVIQIGRTFCPECREIFTHREYKLCCAICRLEAHKCRCGEPALCAIPFKYEGSIRSVIHAFKFDGRKALAEPLADAMAESARMLDCERIDVVCDVPMSRRRLRVRGFNHSEELARAVADKLGAPYEMLLDKQKENREQHLLPAAERRENVRGVYAAHALAEIGGRTVLLCDDVTTTGATLSECVRVLREAGADKVLCVVSAAT